MRNNQEPELFRQQDYFRQFWQQLRQDRLALISFVLFAILLVLVFAGYLFAPYRADQQFIGLELLPPSWSKEGQISYFFGTDNLGRDVFSRILYGFYYTVGASLLISAAIVIIGGVIGVLTGIQKGSPVQLLSHLFGTFLFIPVLLIAIIIATLMPPNLLNAMLAVFLALLPHFIHQIYQVTKRELKREYVVTLVLDGADKWTLIRQVILPNISITVVKSLCQIFAIAVIDISALSFIALGADSQTPEWGAMIRDGIDLIYIAPWTVVLPGIAIVFSVLIIALLGNSVVRVLRQYRH